MALKTKGLFPRAALGAARVPFKPLGLGARAGQEAIEVAMPVLGMGANMLANDPAVAGALSEAGGGIGSALGGLAGTGISALSDMLMPAITGGAGELGGALGGLIGGPGGAAAGAAAGTGLGGGLAALLSGASKAAPVVGSAVGKAAMPLLTKMAPALVGGGVAHGLGKVADMAGVDGSNPMDLARRNSAMTGAMLPMMMAGMGQGSVPDFGKGGPEFSAEKAPGMFGAQMGPPKPAEMMADFQGPPKPKDYDFMGPPKPGPGDKQSGHLDSAFAEKMVKSLPSDVQPRKTNVEAQTGSGSLSDLLKSASPKSQPSYTGGLRGTSSPEFGAPIDGSSSFAAKGVPTPRYGTGMEPMSSMKGAMGEMPKAADFLGSDKQAMGAPSLSQELDGLRAKRSRYPYGPR